MKKFGIAFGIIVIALGAYIAYLFEFKDYDTTDAAVDEVAEEEYVIELADGSKIILDKYGNLIRHVTDEDGTEKIEAFTESFPSTERSDLAVASVSSDNSGTKGSKVKTDASGKAAIKSYAAFAGKKASKKMTVAQIRAKYDPAIAELEGQAHEKLDALIDLAVSEYLEMEANDQKISYPYFYNKYSSAASKLEERTDKMFYALMEVMKQELKKNGLPAAEAEKMSKEYEDRKNKLRRDILKQTAGL